MTASVPTLSSAASAHAAHAAPLDLSALAIGQSFDTVLAVAKVEERQGRKPWLLVELANETGRVETRVWSDQMPAWRGVTHGMAVRVRGEYEASTNPKYPAPTFRVAGAPEIVRDHPVVAVLSQAPAFPGDFADVERRFDTLCGLVSDPAWRRFVQLYFTTTCPRAEFFRAPAGRVMHHAYEGGLAQHTVEVAEGVLRTAHQPEYRPVVDRDLCLVAALVHDADKRAEYSIQGGQYVMSRRGRQYNHVVGGPIEVKLTMERHRGELEALGLTDAHTDDLCGLLAQHHGKIEWGANLEPASLEALILYHNDNLSAKLAPALAQMSTGTIGEGGVVSPAPNTRGPVLLAPTVAPAAIARRGMGGEPVAAAPPRLAPPIEPGPVRGAVKRVDDTGAARVPTASERVAEARNRQGYIPG